MKRLVLFGVLMLACIVLNAAGIILNSGNTSLQMISLKDCAYDVNIENQVAVVTVTETFNNNASANVTPRYYYPLPEGASATQLKWCVNGVWSTALISPNPQNPPGGPTTFPTYFTDYIGRFPIIFDFGSTMSPSDTLQVELTYVQLLTYSQGNVDLVLRNDITTVQSSVLLSQSLSINLVSGRTITDFQLLSHNATNIVNNSTTATAQYISYEALANTDYHLRYTLSANQLGLWAMSTYRNTVPDYLGRGFFTFIAEPDPSNTTQVINKVFTLIIDHSGSMSYDNKVTQAKNAASYIVNHLNEGDMFNIIIFNDTSQALWTTHNLYTPENVTAALTFINSIGAGGMTDIGGAFDVAVPQFSNASDSTANIIIFLTDGQATAGITNTIQLVNHVDNSITASEVGIFLFNFGIGSDVNQQLLSQLANNNSGAVTFLGNNEVYATITDFYNMIRNPVILNPTFTVNPVNAVNEVFPSTLPNLYVGKQMIVSGRYFTPQTTSITFSGQAFHNQVSYQYPLTLTEVNDSIYSFLPKIWAKQKIESLLVQYYILDPNSYAALELKQNIINLSVTWGVITQFTSFTGEVTEDEDITDDVPSVVEIVHLTNYPNPFNPTTTISFEVMKDITGPAILRIYNTKGQLIRTLAVNVNGKGKYQILWDGKDQDGRVASSGIYFYNLTVGNTILSSKMTLMK